MPDMPEEKPGRNWPALLALAGVAVWSAVFLWGNVGTLLAG
jgi:hypothetical protein